MTPINNKVYQPVFVSCKNRPMKVIVFASGSGGNLKAAIDLSLAKPSLVQVGLVVTDRLGIKAIKIAKEYTVPVIASDFEKKCGAWSECKKGPQKSQAYKKAAICFHNQILQQIIKMEKKSGRPFDLVVLTYHRWIHGDLFDYFQERMINQHAGDLTVLDKDNHYLRKYIGINPVLVALKAGEKKTRTSTFVVREGQDNGEILCQGPWVTYTGPSVVTKELAWKHELIQKQKSDWPTLSFALEGIALSHFGLAKNDFYADGGKVVYYKGKPLPYGGVDL